MFHLVCHGVHVVCRGLNGMRFNRVVVTGLLLLVIASPLPAQPQSSEKKLLWKSVAFAIVKFNEEAPKS